MMGKGITYFILGLLIFVLVSVLFLIWFVGPGYSGSSGGFSATSKANLHVTGTVQSKAGNKTEIKREIPETFYLYVEFLVGDKFMGEKIQPPVLHNTLAQGGN